MEHRHDEQRVALGPLPRHVRNRLLFVLVPLIATTLLGVMLLWPSHEPIEGTQGAAADTVTGTVVEIDDCPEGSPEACISGTVRLSDRDGGETVPAQLPYGPRTPTVEVGDRIVLAADENAPAGQQFVFYDFDRSRPMLVLVVIFVIAVIALSRREGIGSLVSLGISLLVLFTFVLPGLSHGQDPLLVAVTGASLIMILALFLTHGVSAMTSVAVIGTLLALLLTAALGVAFTAACNFTGLSDDSNRFVLAVLPNVEFEGLLLAGLIIGALGVLDDVTVTQASAVWELASSDRRATRRDLFSAPRCASVDPTCPQPSTPLSLPMPAPPSRSC